MAHAAGGGEEDAINAARTLPNVYMETCSSSGTHRAVQHSVEGAGADRVLFGTDMPLHDARREIAKVLTADISDDAKRPRPGAQRHRSARARDTGTGRPPVSSPSSTSTLTPADGAASAWTTRWTGTSPSWTPPASTRPASTASSMATPAGATTTPSGSPSSAPTGSTSRPSPRRTTRRSRAGARPGGRRARCQVRQDIPRLRRPAAGEPRLGLRSSNGSTSAVSPS